jgi:hypothetical protein
MYNKLSAVEKAKSFSADHEYKTPFLPDAFPLLNQTQKTTSSPKGRTFSYKNEKLTGPGEWQKQGRPGVAGFQSIISRSLSAFSGGVTAVKTAAGMLHQLFVLLATK